MSRPENGRYGQWAGFPKGNARDPKRCEEQVHERDRGGLHHQCNRKWTVEKPDGSQWCKQHDPDAVAARNVAWRAKYDAERRADELKWELKAKAADIVQAALKANDLPEPLAKLVAEYRQLLLKAKP